MEGPCNGRCVFFLLAIALPLILTQETCPESELDALLGTVIVGCGSATSCTEAVLDRQLRRLQSGSSLVFNCGPQDTVIRLSSTKWLDRNVTVDGGNKVVLDGLGLWRHFVIASRDTSFGVNASGLAVTIKNIRLINGGASPLPMGRRSCQTKDTRGVGGECTGRPLQSQDGLLINPVLKRDGGSIYLGQGGRLVLLSITIENSQSRGTPEPAEEPNDVTLQGGAVFVARGALLVIVNSRFLKNSATQSGGAIHASKGAFRLQISSSSFRDNDVTGSDGQGGAVYVENSTTGIQASQFRANSAHNGGAIYSSDSTLNINSCQFSANQAVETKSDSSGGALFIIGGTTDITGTSFEENQSTDKGGAVYLCTGAEAAFDTSTFCGNGVSSSQTQSGGGALYRDCGGSLTLTEVTMTGNTAKKFDIVSKAGSNLLDAVGDAVVEKSDIAGLAARNGPILEAPGQVCSVKFCQTHPTLCDLPEKESGVNTVDGATRDGSTGKGSSVVTSSSTSEPGSTSDDAGSVGETTTVSSTTPTSTATPQTTKPTSTTTSSPPTTPATSAVPTTTTKQTTKTSTTLATTTTPTPITASPTTTTKATTTTTTKTTTVAVGEATTTKSSGKNDEANLNNNNNRNTVKPSSPDTTPTSTPTTTTRITTNPTQTPVQSEASSGNTLRNISATGGNTVSTGESIKASNGTVGKRGNTQADVGISVATNPSKEDAVNEDSGNQTGGDSQTGTGSDSSGSNAGSTSGSSGSSSTDISDIHVTEDDTVFTRTGNKTRGASTGGASTGGDPQPDPDPPQQGNTGNGRDTASNVDGKSNTAGNDEFGASIVIPTASPPSIPVTNAVNITTVRGPPATDSTLRCLTVTAHTNNWINRNFIVAECPSDFTLVGCSSQSPGGARRRGEQFVIVGGRMACSAHRVPTQGGVVAVARCCHLPSQGSCAYQLGPESVHSSQAVSQVQCNRGSLTSCGVYGEHGRLAGSRPLTSSRIPNSLQDTAAICRAFNGADATPSGIFAKAICCQIPRLICRAKFSIESSPGGDTAVTCDAGWFLTGCSAWSSSAHATGSSPTDQTGNTCLASSENTNQTSSVWAIATCCTLEQSSENVITGSGTDTGVSAVCDGKICQNGGTLLSNGCRCVCKTAYQGSACQRNREESSRGVEITFKTKDFDKIKLEVMHLIAAKLSSHCNKPEQFARCCPGKGAKNRSDILPYVTASDIRIAEGYPEVVPLGVKVMFLVTPNPDNSLCSKGGTTTVRTIRSLQSVRQKRNTFGDGFLEQDILLEVIKESAPNITQEIGVEIVAVEPGKEDVPVNNVDTLAHQQALPSWVIPLVIGCCVITVTAVVMTAVAVVKMKQRKSQLSPTKTESEVSESTEDVGSNMWEVREAAREASRVARKTIKYPESMTLPSVRGYKPYPHGTVSQPTMYYSDYPNYYGMFYTPTTMYYPTQQPAQQTTTT